MRTATRHLVLEDDTGETWGPFDRLLLTPPAPQTAELLRSGEWGDRDGLRADLVDAIDDVSYRSVWTGIFHYPFELEVPYYALVNTDKAHEIGWVAREECKPGHVPDGDSLLVVQANHEWFVAHIDEPPAETLEKLATLTADLLEDDRLTDPEWTDHQGGAMRCPRMASIRTRFGQPKPRLVLSRRLGRRRGSPPRCASIRSRGR